MVETVKKQFEDAGFIVIKTSIKNLGLDDEIVRAVEQQRSISPVSQILMAYPDLFIFPRSVPPIKGCLFGVVQKDANPPELNQKETLDKYFPPERTAFFTIKDDQIFVFWNIDGAKKSIPITEFITALTKASET